MGKKNYVLYVFEYDEFDSWGEVYKCSYSIKKDVKPLMFLNEKCVQMINFERGDK